MGVGVAGTLLVLWASLSCDPRQVEMVWAVGFAVAPSPPPCAPRATGVRRGPKRLRCRRACRARASAGLTLVVHWWGQGRAGGVPRSGGMTVVALFRWRVREARRGVCQPGGARGDAVGGCRAGGG